jgi:hypothetical protein
MEAPLKPLELFPSINPSNQSLVEPTMIKVFMDVIYEDKSQGVHFLVLYTRLLSEMDYYSKPLGQALVQHLNYQGIVESIVNCSTLMPYEALPLESCWLAYRNSSILC